MTYSHLGPAMKNRVAWNAGKTVRTKRPLTQKQIWAIRFFLDREERLRDRSPFDLAIYSKLPGCDLVKLKIGDLVAGPDIRTRALLIQQKRLADSCSLKSRLTSAAALRHGSNAVAERPIIRCSPVARITVT